MRKPILFSLVTLVLILGGLAGTMYSKYRRASADFTEMKTAEAAGIRPFRFDDRDNVTTWGDIIVAVDGSPIRSRADLSRLLRGRKRGELVSVKVVRGGTEAPTVVDVPVALK